MEEKHQKDLRIAGILFTLYILTGVIIFPGWYFSVLQEGGISGLLNEGLTRYFVWNIAAIAVIILAVITVNFIEKNHGELHVSINEFAKSKIFLFVMWLIMAIAIFRLLGVSIFSKNKEINELAVKIQNIENITISKPIVSTPIDPIFINELKLSEIYAQLTPQLELSEKNIGTKNVVSSEGKIGSDAIASVGLKSEGNSEQQDKYTTRKLSVSEKLVSVINFLDKEKSLEKIVPVAIDDKDLIKIDESIRTLESYKIEVNANQLEKTRKEIKNKAFQSKASETYKINSWVLISGPVSIVNSHDKNFISINFEYASGENSGVNFSCDIPSSSIDKSELSALRSETTWDLNVFGRIIRQKNGETIKYSVNCLSIYR